MADDDSNKDDGFDPWAEPEDAASASSPSFDAEPNEDDAVAAWLSGDEDTPGDPPLSVFVPDEPVDPAAIEIGTGMSGVMSPSDIADVGGLEEIEAAWDVPAAIEIPASGPEGGHVDEPAVTIAFVGSSEPSTEDVATGGMADTDSDAEVIAVEAAAFPVVGGSEPPVSRAQAKRRGGLGQLVGVVLGGLLALPLVLGILVGLMWLGWKDTVGIREWMPQSLAFLLPPRAVSALDAATTGGGPSVSTGPSLDDVAAAEPAPIADVAPMVDAEPLEEQQTASVEGATEPPESVAIEPAPADTAAMDPSATEPAGTEPAGTEPGAIEAVPSAEPLAADVMPAIDELTAVTAVVEPYVPAMPAIPEPEPLDFAPLEAAVAEASLALDAVQAGGDERDLARKRRLVEWYRQLVRMAQELAAVESLAADSGRPLTSPPDGVVALESRMLAATDLTADLATLAGSWLEYSRRDGDGVVIPGTFSGSRRVGPFFCSRVTVAEPAGTSRAIAVISRAEPVATAGDPVVITGLAMDSGVIWASDIRSAAASDPVGVVAP